MKKKNIGCGASNTQVTKLTIMNNVHTKSDMDDDNLPRVKTEQVLSEMEATNVAPVASEDINSVKPQECSHIKSLLIEPVMQLDKASRLQQSSTLDAPQYNDQVETFNINDNVKIEPVNTEDPLCSPQAGAESDCVALGLNSTCDIPLDIVKEEPENIYKQTDPLHSPQTAVPDREALGLHTTCDLPPDIVKEDLDDEDTDPSALHKHEDYIPENPTISDEANCKSNKRD